jgi:hypothetical protein
VDIVDCGSDAAPEMAAELTWPVPAPVQRWTRIRHSADLLAAHRWAVRAARASRPRRRR